MCNFLETRQTKAGKNTGQCLTHVNKIACEIWSCFDNVQFSQKLNVRVLPSRLQFVVVPNGFNNLLGLKTIQELGFLTINEECFICQIKAPHLGDLGEVTLRIDENAQPKV